jgi:hypothetical protein
MYNNDVGKGVVYAYEAYGREGGREGGREERGDRQTDRQTDKKRERESYWKRYSITSRCMVLEKGLPRR